MASKGKNVGTLTANKPQSAEQEADKFRNDLRKISQELQRICDERGLQQYGELFDRSRDMEKKMEAQDRVITELQHGREALEKKYDDLVAGIMKKGAESSSKHKELEEEIQKLAQENKQLEKDRIDDKMNLRTKDIELGETHKRVEDLEQQSQKDHEELSRLREQLLQSQKTLKDLQGNVGILQSDRSEQKELNDLRRKFQELSTRSYQLVQRYFAQEIPSENIRAIVLPKAAPPELRRIFDVVADSAAAPALRCAFAEAIIAQQLHRHIFKNFFHPQGPSEVLEFQGFLTPLEQMWHRFPLEADHIRCLIAKVWYQLAPTHTIAKEAATRVHKILKHWIGNQEAQKQFEQQLCDFFSDSTEVWRKSQRILKQVVSEVNTHSKWSDQNDSRLEYGAVQSVAEERGLRHSIPFALSSPIAVLFPRIEIDSRVERDREVLFRGFALFPTQSAFAAALDKRESTHINSASTLTPTRPRPSELSQAGDPTTLRTSPPRR